MTQIIIRPAVSADRPSIVRISRNLGYEEQLDEQRFAEKLEHILKSEIDYVWVAVDAGQVLGWIHGFVTTPLASDAFMEIGGLAIDTDQQRRGLGSRLLQHAKQQAVAEGLSLRVRCNHQRLGALEFYRNQGLREIKQQCVFSSV